MTIPILFIGDSPADQSGLSRIGRDIATHVASTPGFRVGYLGRGETTSRKLPFIQYTYEPTLDAEWGEHIYPQVFRDFFGPDPRHGIVFTIWDPYRLGWFGAPHPRMESFAPELWQAVSNPNVEKWGYFPIDSHGHGDRLTKRCEGVLRGYDVPLAYTPFGQDVMQRTIDSPVDWIPHGLNLDIYKPMDPDDAKESFGVDTGKFVVGTVMTNQPRKDWGVWAETARALLDVIPEATFLIRTDSLERYWSIRGLVEDFGLSDVLGLSNVLSNIIEVPECSDRRMVQFYNACDILLHPAYEGFGYPIAEAFACGTPVVAPWYGGGSYLMDCAALANTIGGTYPFGVPVPTLRLDTRWNIYRAEYRSSEFATRVFDYYIGDLRISSEDLRRSVEHLDWRKLWPRVWGPWFQDQVAKYKERNSL